MANLTPAQWANFKKIVNTFSNDPVNGTALAEFIWVKTISASIPRMGNDEDTQFKSQITLHGLFEYNVKRVWPLTKYTDGGEEDIQSLVIMLNIAYLIERGYLNTDGNFSYDAAKDKFIVNGLTYYSAGDTLVSQAQRDALWYYLVLRRSDFAT